MTEDQRETWRKAIVASRRQQRQRRGRRTTGIAAVRQAGMVRRASRDGYGGAEDGSARLPSGHISPSGTTPTIQDTPGNP